MAQDVTALAFVSAPIAVSDWLELRTLFKEAEDSLHEAETIHGDLAIPSVNQLRYAGHHVVSLAACTTAAEAEEAYSKARRHCQRAIYDAYDSAISYLLKNIEQFKADYSKIEIGPHFPNYLAVIGKAREARDLLIKARNTQDAREDYYTQCRTIARELRDYHDQMEDVREELNKAIRAHNRNVFLGWGGLVVTLIGTVAAVLALK